jgi:hypothetical protein
MPAGPLEALLFFAALELLDLLECSEQLFIPDSLFIFELPEVAPLSMLLRPPMPLPLLLVPADGLLLGTPLDCAKEGVAKPNIAAAAIAPTAAVENKMGFFEDIAFLPWLAPQESPQAQPAGSVKGSSFETADGTTTKSAVNAGPTHDRPGSDIRMIWCSMPLRFLC